MRCKGPNACGAAAPGSRDGRPFPLLRGQDEESSLTSQRKKTPAKNNCSHRFGYVKSVVFQLHGVDRTEQPRVEGAETTVKVTNWTAERADERHANRPGFFLAVMVSHRK